MSRGLADSVLYDENKVFERFQLSPKQIIDYKALAGDPSDNIPGAKGIGIKTATELLIQFNNLETLYQAIDKKNAQIKTRTSELLQESKDNVFLSKTLATIDRQAPIILSLDEAKFTHFDINIVLKLFNNLEFRSLLKKVQELQGKLQESNPNQSENKVIEEEKIKQKQKDTNYEIILNDNDFSDFITKLKGEKCFAIHLELLDQKDQQEIFALSFSWKTNTAHFVPINNRRLQELKPILENKAVKKIGHNLKATWHTLKVHNITLQGLDFDVMIAAYLLFPGERNYELEALALMELEIDQINNQEINSQPRQLGFDFEKTYLEKISLLVNEKADIIWQLKIVLEQKLGSTKLLEVFTNIEMPLINILSDMEDCGISVNEEHLHKLSLQVEKKLKKLETQIHELATEKFNINSPKQLKEILFEKLNIPTQGIKKTKTGFSTADDELFKLQKVHPIILLIQDYRELAKLDST